MQAGPISVLVTNSPAALIFFPIKSFQFHSFLPTAVRVHSYSCYLLYDGPHLYLLIKKINVPEAEVSYVRLLSKQFDKLTLCAARVLSAAPATRLEMLSPDGLHTLRMNVKYKQPLISISCWVYAADKISATELPPVSACHMLAADHWNISVDDNWDENSSCQLDPGLKQ